MLVEPVVIGAVVVGAQFVATACGLYLYIKLKKERELHNSTRKEFREARKEFREALLAEDDERWEKMIMHWTLRARVSEALVALSAQRPEAFDASFMQPLIEHMGGKEWCKNPVVEVNMPIVNELLREERQASWKSQT